MAICGTATKKPLTCTAFPGNLLWRMALIAQDYAKTGQLP
jgi:hypothetical protein